ncbi:hypothetical protein Ancab_002279, partial [Ancistrocladus abbreviatus]
DLDCDTRLKSRLDRACFVIRTPILETINIVIWVKIDQEVFPINVAKELCRIGDWRSSTQEAIVKVPDSPSVPSTSVSVVPDSVGNAPASEQQFGAAPTSAVVAKALKFKFGGNDVANHSPIDSRPTDGMEVAVGSKHVQDASSGFGGAGRRAPSVAGDRVTPLGGACWASHISPIGPERSIGALSNMGLGLEINKLGGLDGPGDRPEIELSSSAVQREEVAEVRSVPEVPHLQMTSERRKCKKKSLSDDILQLQLSKRVIGKGTVRRRVGRTRSGMEDTTDSGGLISSRESIRDSQFINRNKWMIELSSVRVSGFSCRLWCSLVVFSMDSVVWCGRLESISKSIATEEKLDMVSGGFLRWSHLPEFGGLFGCRIGVCVMQGDAVFVGV